MGTRTSSNSSFRKSKRPSDSRRESLIRADDCGSTNQTIITISNLIAIERYYAASDKLLLAFRLCYEKGDLDNAYVFGKRFARFATESLPTHDEYMLSSRQSVKRIRRKNIDDLSDVIECLEYITSLMDMEEMGQSINIESREG